MCSRIANVMPNRLGHHQVCRQHESRLRPYPRGSLGRNDHVTERIVEQCDALARRSVHGMVFAAVRDVLQSGLSVQHVCRRRLLLCNHSLAACMCRSSPCAQRSRTFSLRRPGDPRGTITPVDATDGKHGRTGGEHEEPIWSDADMGLVSAANGSRQSSGSAAAQWAADGADDGWRGRQSSWPWSSRSIRAGGGANSLFCPASAHRVPAAGGGRDSAISMTLARRGCCVGAVSWARANEGAARGAGRRFPLGGCQMRVASLVAAALGSPRGPYHGVVPACHGPRLMTHRTPEY